MEENVVEYKFPFQPLKEGYNRLRTAGLASEKSATFGMVRTNKDGTPRAHQGIDLAIPNGYRCYAVDDGEIVAIQYSNAGYGNTVLIKLHNGLFVFYAHLGRIDVNEGDYVMGGDIIGLSGSSGNAKGMTTIERGSHLHFEVRNQRFVTLGLGGRLNPLDYFDLDENPLI